MNMQSAVEADFNILIVSSNRLIREKLQSSLISVWSGTLEERKYHCKVQNSDIFGPGKSIPQVDYVVFVIEAQKRGCLQEIETNLEHLPDTFGRQKICIVASGASYGAATPPEELWKFAKAYQFNLLMGDVETKEKAEHLSERILTMSEASCGLINGIPLVGRI